MGKLVPSKWQAITPGWVVHGISLVAIFVVGNAFVSKWPELLEGPVAKFGTIGTMVTVYGMAFAIIEAVRAKSVARQASAAAQTAVDQLSRLSKTDLITSCSHLIEAAQDTAAQGNGLPVVLLTKIVALYSQLFPDMVADSESDHFNNKGMLVAYIGAPRPSKSPRKTLAALTNIQSHLSVLKADTLDILET